MPIEIQVRSSLQHLWAEVSEKSSDVLDPTIKYGGGIESWRNFLSRSSESVAAYEEFEKRYSEAVLAKKVADQAHEKFKRCVEELPANTALDHESQELRGKLEESTRAAVRRQQKHQELQRELERLWDVNANRLNGAISLLDILKGRRQ